MNNETKLPEWIETLAESWDGCMYDAPGDTLDIGASIRNAARKALSQCLHQLQEQSTEAQEAWRAGIDEGRAQMAAIAAATVVFPEPNVAISDVMRMVASFGETSRKNMAIELREAEFQAIESKLRALLATGGQAQAVEQAPVLYVSKGQLDNHRDPDGPDSANAGRYLPARITPAGNFTMPLFAAPQAQAEHIKALIEVSRMPNQEHVADAHNAAVRHLRAIAAAKE